MSLQVRNTRSLIDPATFRFVMLIYGLPGTGKTSWIGTLPPEQVGIAACETGVGKGLLTIADKGFECCEPENLNELEKFCKGEVFPTKRILVLDSLSSMAKTFIKDAALAIPRKQGESPKRKLGIPELDDYGSIGEMTRKLLILLTGHNPTKHIIVTATEKYDRPNENDPPGTESLIGPDLAGQMFLGAPAMFDFVLRLRTRPKLRNPADPRSRYNERYFLTTQESGVIAKCRGNSNGTSLLDREEIFDLTTGQGSFDYLLNKILKGYETTNPAPASVVVA